MDQCKNKYHNYTISTKLYLEDLPSYALWYKNRNGKSVFWDSTAFRPDIRNILTVGKKYSAKCLFDSENLPGNKTVIFPKEMEVAIAPKKKVKFVNVR